MYGRLREPSRRPAEWPYRPHPVAAELMGAGGFISVVTPFGAGQSVQGRFGLLPWSKGSRVRLGAKDRRDYQAYRYGRCDLRVASSARLLPWLLPCVGRIAGPRSKERAFRERLPNLFAGGRKRGPLRPYGPRLRLLCDPTLAGALCGRFADTGAFRRRRLVSLHAQVAPTRGKFISNVVESRAVNEPDSVIRETLSAGAVSVPIHLQEVPNPRRDWSELASRRWVAKGQPYPSGKPLYDNLLESAPNRVLGLIESLDVLAVNALFELVPYRCRCIVLNRSSLADIANPVKGGSPIGTNALGELQDKLAGSQPRRMRHEHPRRVQPAGERTSAAARCGPGSSAAKPSRAGNRISRTRRPCKGATVTA